MAQTRNPKPRHPSIILETDLQAQRESERAARREARRRIVQDPAYLEALVEDSLDVDNISAAMVADCLRGWGFDE